jgi:hypothetical protein
MKIKGETKYSEIKAPVPLCPLQIPRDLTWDWSVFYQDKDTLLKQSLYC